MQIDAEREKEKIKSNKLNTSGVPLAQASFLCIIYLRPRNGLVRCTEYLQAVLILSVLPVYSVYMQERLYLPARYPSTPLGWTKYNGPNTPRFQHEVIWT